MIPKIDQKLKSKSIKKMMTFPEQDVPKFGARMEAKMVSKFFSKIETGGIGT